MLPNITLVQVNPFLLNTGETNIVVTATVTDDGGVIDVVAVHYDVNEGWAITAETPLTLESGDSQNGIYTGTVVIPLAPDIIDGLYGVAVLAANAEAVQGDLSTYAINTDSMITLQRGNGGNGGNADDDNSDKGCCKVSINISSGPVNIYVCGTESK
jgi:hypothetical protein